MSRSNKEFKKPIFRWVNIKDRLPTKAKIYKVGLKGGGTGFEIFDPKDQNSVTRFEENVIKWQEEKK